MNNKKIILKSNEAYALITSAISNNRVGEKLLTPTEVEELIYYLLEQEYKDNIFNMRLTKDNTINQLRFGDITIITNDGEIITNEVKSEKPYQGLYKLRIDLMYVTKANYNVPYIQQNTNNSNGWAYKICNYDKIYVHFHDNTSKYKSMIFVINNPYQLYLDCMELIKIGSFGTYNINQVEFDIFHNNNDYSKTTICTSFNLLGYEARERYNIDLIHLEIKLE